MSDAPTPPLRMKPRLTVSPEQSAKPAPPDAAAASSSFKLRPPAQPPAAAVPFVHPFLSESGEAKPASSLSPTSPSPTHPSPPAAAPFPPKPAPPVAAPQKVIHIRAPKPPSSEAALPTKAEATASASEKKPGIARRLAVAAAVTLVLSAAAIFAYRLKFPSARSPSAPATKAATGGKPRGEAAPSGTALTPSDSLNAAANAPARAIAQAQSVTDAVRIASQGGFDSLTGGELPALPPAGQVRGPARASTPVVTTAVTLSPGIIMSVPDEAVGAATADPAFRSFIADAKIGGVRTSATSTSALINNRLVRIGQPVDNGLGITIIFASVNPEIRELVFKDKSGATVTRRY